MKKVIKIAATKLIIIAATIISLFFVMGFSSLKTYADTPEVTNLTGYTWNAHYYTFGSLSIKYINFTSNDSSYSSIKTEEGMEANIVYYGTEPVCDDMSGYIDRNYETIVITGGTDVTNTTLIAWLEANGTLTPPELVGYEVTFVTNGGSSISPITGATELPSPLPTTTKSNNIFVGWFYDSVFEEQAFSGDTITSNITLYAKWRLSEDYIAGYDDGYATGYGAGYWEGYDDGYNQGGIDVIDIGWFRTVMSGIAVIFSIKVFGDITLATFIGIPLLFAIILWIKKLLS